MSIRIKITDCSVGGTSAMHHILTTESTRTDATRTDATRTDATRTDATCTDATRTDATRTDATRTDATRTDKLGLRPQGEVGGLEGPKI